MNDKLKFISQEYYRKFEKLKIRIPISTLQNSVAKETLKAEKNYPRIQRVYKGVTFVCIYNQN